MTTLRPPLPERLRAKRPHGLTGVNCSQDVKDGLIQEALDIFSIIANHGGSFAEALFAVYLSGLACGAGAERERAKGSEHD